MGAQLLGATVACVFFWLTFGKVGMLGATLPGTSISVLQALRIEFVLTLGLMSVILGTASKEQQLGG
jgi:aquaporin Z